MAERDRQDDGSSDIPGSSGDLIEPTMTCGPAGTTESSPNQLDPSPRVDHYRLLDSIGHGGMGIVYRAEDVRLGRHVAVRLQ